MHDLLKLQPWNIKHSDTKRKTKFFRNFFTFSIKKIYKTCTTPQHYWIYPKLFSKCQNLPIIAIRIKQKKGKKTIIR